PLSNLHINIGVLHLQRGSPRLGRRHFEAGAQAAREHGKQGMLIIATYQLGRVELQAGSLAPAKSAFERALEIATSIGVKSAAIDNIAGLAWVAFEEGFHADACEVATIVRDSKAATPGTKRWMEELLVKLPAVSVDSGAMRSPGVTGLVRRLEMVG